MALHRCDGLLATTLTGFTNREIILGSVRSTELIRLPLPQILLGYGIGSIPPNRTPVDG